MSGRTTASSSGGRHGCLTAGFVVMLVLGLGAAGLFVLWVGLRVVLGTFDGLIYPNVYVQDVDLGGLSPQEASATLASSLGGYDAGIIILQDGERSWPVPWADLGMNLNVDATVRAALEAGRADQSLWAMAGVWFGRRDVAPVLVIDPSVARVALEQLAPQMSQPAVDATLGIGGSGLVAVPGQPGKEVDVDLTLERLLSVTAGQGVGGRVAIAFRTVMPGISDASAAQAQAEELVGRELVLSTYDVQTGEEFSWTLGRDILVTWLRVVREGDGLAVRGDEENIRSTLAQLTTALGGGRGFRLDEATGQVLVAFENQGEYVDLYMTHPQWTYTVQYGDTVTNIGVRLGVPPGLIAEVNQGVDLDTLRVGQTLTIPSQDDLTPYLPVRGKRIEISIAEQRMRVYQNGTLLYDWPVSTGIESSPTYPGLYQVLSKEENAYGSQWDLWMPHFISIYRAGGDVYNGIHGLPTLSSGQLLWAGLLGSPASFGCIILDLDEAGTLFNWVETGVVVEIE